MSPRLGTRARGSAAAPGHAGRRANPGRPGLHNAKYPPPAANITSSGENANAKPGRITGYQGCPRRCGGVEQKDWDTARGLLAPGVRVAATHTGSYPPPTDLTGAGDHMTGLTAEPIVPGSVRELAGVGDDHNALLPWTCRPRSTRRARRCREHRQDPDPRAASNGPTSTARSDPIGGSR